MQHLCLAGFVCVVLEYTLICHRINFDNGNRPVQVESPWWAHERILTP